ncbi:hypothetical protein DY000_02010298 [Brassica cretica]|uniref:Uncharacterized protein n=1 Tax=Brassica cretica TaxID=69181 RepID=A0ABQ7BU55_BRACR|nr:hypothetical protein DY000_02010298 [Brassica cretica]
MLVKAMEVSGIEGNFRSICENVMQVLRTNKDSVIAMTEAFVHIFAGGGRFCGVVRCGVVINMYVGVGVLVGILGVRKVLTYSVTYLGEVLGDVPSETWRLKPRLRGSLAQVNSNTGQGPGE